MLGLRDKRDLVNLPTADRMRDGQVHIGVPRWIIDSPMERAVRLEKLRIEFDFALNIDWTNRRAELHNLVHKLLLRSRGGEGHAHLRAEP